MWRTDQPLYETDLWHNWHYEEWLKTILWFVMIKFVFASFCLKKLVFRQTYIFQVISCLICCDWFTLTLTSVESLLACFFCIPGDSQQIVKCHNSNILMPIIIPWSSLFIWISQFTVLLSCFAPMSNNFFRFDCCPLSELWLIVSLARKILGLSLTMPDLIQREIDARDVLCRECIQMCLNCC